MMSYFDVYRKRANRYGVDYQSRVQGEREQSFDLYLMKSIYRVDFSYEDEVVEGSFEQYKQDDTQTLHYLLTRTNINIPNGTILMIPNKDGIEKPWMVYYLEFKKARGCNRYIMLKMSHYLTWNKKDGSSYNSWAYLYGAQSGILKNTIQSNATGTVYSENERSNFFIMPLNSDLKIDDYLTVGTEPYDQYFRVTGYDAQSSEGVEYVTIDPIYKFDLTPAPTKEEGDSSEEFYWLEGGVSDD